MLFKESLNQSEFPQRNDVPKKIVRFSGLFHTVAESESVAGHRMFPFNARGREPGLGSRELQVCILATNRYTDRPKPAENHLV